MTPDGASLVLQPRLAGGGRVGGSGLRFAWLSPTVYGPAGHQCEEARSPRSAPAMATAAVAASKPLLPAPGMLRSRAWAASWTASTALVTGIPAVERGCGQPGRRLVDHDLVVVGVTLDHGTHGDDTVAPRPGQGQGGHRELEGAGDSKDRDLLNSRTLESIEGPAKQSIGENRVVGGDGDPDM